MTSCPWCHNDAVKPYLNVKDLFLTQESFEIFECPQCHLLFTSPRPAPDVIGRYYESKDYYSHQENQHGFIPKIYESVKKVNLRNKVKLAIGDLPKGHLLDIGCGVGDFLLQIVAKGWQIHGIEPSEGARKISTARLGVSPLLPSESCQLEDASLDVITLWHVLEHVDDLHFQINEFQRLLKPGGRLVLAVPNYQSFDAKHYGAFWAAWDVPRHLNHFCLDSLDPILHSVGFQLEKVAKLKWDAYYISYMSEKYLGHRLALLRGAFVGLRSNLKALTSMQYSSMVYVYTKEKGD